MDVNELLARLRSVVEGARSMPMSTSAVVNRAEILELIAALEQALPSAFAGQDEVVAERDAVVADGRAESLRLVADAERERDRLVGETEVLRVAKTEAERERVAARAEAAELRKDTDAYVDTRLATFEVTLTRTLEAVARGRARLQGRSQLEGLAEPAAARTGPAEDSLATPSELVPSQPEDDR